MKSHLIQLTLFYSILAGLFIITFLSSTSVMFNCGFKIYSSELVLDRVQVIIWRSKMVPAVFPILSTSHKSCPSNLDPKHRDVSLRSCSTGTVMLETCPISAVYHSTSEVLIGDGSRQEVPAGPHGTHASQAHRSIPYCYLSLSDWVERDS